MAICFFFVVCNYFITINKGPATISTTPTIDFHVKASRRNKTAKTSVKTMLSLSIATTAVVFPPVCNAL